MQRMTSFPISTNCTIGEKARDSCGMILCFRCVFLLHNEVLCDGKLAVMPDHRFEQGSQSPA